MQDMRVAAVSTRNRIGQPVRAISDMTRWGEKARERGAEFILFPELNVSGYFHSTEALRFSEPIPGPSTEALVDLAARLDAILCFGILENEADIAYNTQVVVNGGGILGKQRKIHMPGVEYLYWRGGFSIEPIDVGKARIGIAICFDSLFMEQARTLFLKGAEILVMPFAYDTKGPRKNAPERDVSVMSYRVNCHSNGFFGIVANNAGSRRKTQQEGSKIRFPGWAGVFDPNGEVMAWTKGPGNGEAMVVADLKAERLYNRRRSSYFTPRSLRPSCYAAITDGEQTGRCEDRREA